MIGHSARAYKLEAATKMLTKIFTESRAAAGKISAVRESLQIQKQLVAVTGGTVARQLVAAGAPRTTARVTAIRVRLNGTAGRSTSSGRRQNDVDFVGALLVH